MKTVTIQHSLHSEAQDSEMYFVILETLCGNTVAEVTTSPFSSRSCQATTLGKKARIFAWHSFKSLVKCVVHLLVSIRSTTLCPEVADEANIQAQKSLLHVQHVTLGTSVDQNHSNATTQN